MRKFLLGASAAAVLAFVAGCGNDSTMPGMQHSGSTAPQPSAPSAKQGHNAEDITFAQGMIPHHAQAVEMTELVSSRSTNPKVTDLAKRIQAAQGPEIGQLTDMLKNWGGAVPTSAPSTPGMDHSGHGSGGMMTTDEMKQLEQAKGAEFDRLWIQMMIKHHDGAVEMAKAQLSKGDSSAAKALARKIVDGQQAEITEMRALLK